MEPASGSAFSYPAAGIIAKDASIPRPGISITAIHIPKKQKQRSSKHLNRHISRDFPSQAANPSNRRTRKSSQDSCKRSKKATRRKMSGATPDISMMQTSSPAEKSTPNTLTRCSPVSIPSQTASSSKPKKISPWNSAEAATRESFTLMKSAKMRKTKIIH